MKYFLTILLHSMLLSIVLGQQLDTTQVKKILEYEAKMDSLRFQIRTLNDELQTIKANLTAGTDLDVLLTALGEEEDDSVPADQRSRRKRVDALLKVITQRPGQLRFNGGATTIFQSNLGDDKFSTATGSIDIYAHTSLGRNTLLFFAFEGIGGDGPNQRVATLSPVNGDAGSTQSDDGLDRLTILEAWAEFTVFSEEISITAGKIDLTNYFDNNNAANDETSQFISSGFVNSAALPAPANSAGLQVRTTLLNRFFVQLAAASVDNSGNDIFEEIFKIGSMGFKVFPESKWEGNLRLYLYSHPSANNAVGYGTSFDQSVGGAFRLFARWNRNTDELGDWFGVSSARSVGAQFTKKLGNKQLILAGAYGETKPSQPLRIERAFEAYARYRLSRWVYISPHLQLVFNTNGSSDNLTLLGLRTQFNF